MHKSISLTALNLKNYPLTHYQLSITALPHYPLTLLHDFFFFSFRKRSK